uniref:Uncharacterized protein n=1 Tax=Calidris pygmaea TaxID=425635 RepID=A0A8C3J675_9CHAR
MTYRKEINLLVWKSSSPTQFTPNLLNSLILQHVKQKCSDKSHIFLQQLEIKNPVFFSVRVNKTSNLLNSILANTMDNESYSIVKDF